MAALVFLGALSGFGSATAAPPEITRQPVSQRLLAGDRAVFSTSTTGGVGFFDYQWFKNGELIVNEDQAALVLRNIMPADSAFYQVRATNRDGAIWSERVRLDVIFPPQVPGALDLSFHAGNVSGDSVHDIEVFPDTGKLLVAGEFASIAGHAVKSLAMLNPDGTVDASFNGRGSGADEKIRAVEVLDDGCILAVGDFESFNGTSAGRIVRLDSNGAVDDAFPAFPGADNDIRAMAIQSDGKILIGGKFNNVHGVARQFLARLLPDGRIDPSFNSRLQLNNGVEAIAIQAGGAILIGGDFISIDGNTQRHLARLNPDGTVDPSFPSGVITNRAVLTIAFDDDGCILIGGKFTTVHGMGIRGIAKLLANGSVVEDFHPDPNDFVRKIDFDAQGRVIVAGDFTQIAGETIAGIARLEAVKGEIDVSFAPVSTDKEIESFCVQPDGDLMVGGRFERPHDRIMRLRMDTPETPPMIIGQPRSEMTAEGTHGYFLVAATGNPSLSYQWLFNGRVIDGATESELILPSTSAEASGIYEVLITNGEGSVTSQSAILNLSPPALGEPRYRAYANTTSSKIEPLGTLSIPVVITDDFPIEKAIVHLDITHKDTNDLEARLMAPDGTTITLFAKPGRRGHDFDYTVFDDESPLTLSDNVAPFLGTYRPESLLSVVNGDDSLGTWRLLIDNFGAETGTVNSWTLELRAKLRPMSFTTWREFYESNLRRDLPPDEDFNFDGRNNFDSYALGESPAVPFSGLTGVSEIADGLTFSHRRWTSTADVIYAYEVSTDLVTWIRADAGIDYEVVLLERIGGGKENVRVHFPIEALGGRGLVRLSTMSPQR